MSSDLEKEAREAAEAAFPPGPGRLGGKLYAGKPAKEGFRERSWFQKGFIAAAESREKEIAKLRAALMVTGANFDSGVCEIASLLAQVADLTETVERLHWTLERPEERS